MAISICRYLELRMSLYNFTMTPSKSDGVLDPSQSRLQDLSNESSWASNNIIELSCSSQRSLLSIRFGCINGSDVLIIFPFLHLSRPGLKFSHIFFKLLEI